MSETVQPAQTERKRRPKGSYSEEFACESCERTDRPPYRRGLCNTCYMREYMRSRRQSKPGDRPVMAFRRNRT